MSRSIALYDFTGDASNDEISFNAGDILTITDDTGLDGWWYGKTLDGQEGIFPQLYVEKLDVDLPQPQFQAPAPPTSTPVNRANSTASIWASQLANRLRSVTEAQGVEDRPSPPQQNSVPSPPLPIVPLVSMERTKSIELKRSGTLLGAPVSSLSFSGSENAGIVGGSVINNDSVTGSAAGQKHFKQNKIPGKSLNRWSDYVTFGVEQFMLRKSSLFHDVGVKPYFVVESDTPMLYKWKAQGHLQIQITGHEVKTSLFSQKTYYQVTSEVSVKRSYKQFQWLQSCLVKEFPLLVSHHLPSVSFVPETYDGLKGSQMYEVASSVETHMRVLERYLQQVAIHPVMSQSEAFSHFLECEGRNKMWKFGCNRVERALKVGNCFDKVSLPAEDTFETPESLKVTLAECTGVMTTFDANSLAEKLVRLKESAVLHLAAAPSMKNLYLRTSAALLEVNNCSMLIGDCSDQAQITDLARQIATSSQAFTKGEYSQTYMSVLETCSEYEHTLAESKKLSSVHSALMHRLRQAVKYNESGKMDSVALNQLNRRGQVVHSVITAEVYRLHNEFGKDFNKMSSLLQGAMLGVHEDVSQSLKK